MPFFGKDQYKLEGFLTACTFDYLNKDIYTRAVIILMVVFGFLVPLCVILIMYFLIMKKLRTRKRNFETSNSIENFSVNMSEFEQLDPDRERRTQRSSKNTIDDLQMHLKFKKRTSSSTDTIKMVKFKRSNALVDTTQFETKFKDIQLDSLRRYQLILKTQAKATKTIILLVGKYIFFF